MYPKKELLRKIQMLDFTLQDLSLYLNLHPNDMEALKSYCSIKEQLCYFRKEYEVTYGLLCNRSCANNDYNSYIGNLWPWEREEC